MTNASRSRIDSADAATDRPSTAVVMAVADAIDAEPTALPPLYEAIDPDALDRLFRSKPSGETRFSGQVTFGLAGCEVVVHADGDVDATPVGSTDA